MGQLELERVDLADLTGRIVTVLGVSRVAGLVVGRTKLRNAAVLVLSCSELEAEELVDTLAMRGFVRFRRSKASEGGGEWVVRSAPDSTR